jgi:hypothetical protein
VSPPDSLLDGASDAWRYGLLGGLVSVPFTAVGYWQTGSELSLSTVFLGGLLAGYLARRRSGTAAGVGVRVGLVGSLPVLWLLSDVLGAASALSGPAWFVAGALALTVARVAVVAVGAAVLVGVVGTRVGGGLAGRDGGERAPPATGN